MALERAVRTVSALKERKSGLLDWKCINMQLSWAWACVGQRPGCLYWLMLYQPYVFLPHKMSTFSALRTVI